MTQRMNKTALQEALDKFEKNYNSENIATRLRAIEDIRVWIPTMRKHEKGAQAYADVVHENEHLKACLKADNDIQNRIIKLAEPFMNIQNGKTYSAYHALDMVERIVKAYSDLPEKIEGLQMYKLTQSSTEILVEIDDILNLLKEGAS